MNKKRYPKITFLNSLYLNATFAASLYAYGIFIMPVLVLSVLLQSYWFYVLVIGAIILIIARLTYCFWLTVKYFIGGTVLESCIMHLWGWGLFLILYLLSLAWIIPLSLQRLDFLGQVN